MLANKEDWNKLVMAAKMVSDPNIQVKVVSDPNIQVKMEKMVSDPNIQVKLGQCNTKPISNSENIQTQISR